MPVCGVNLVTIVRIHCITALLRASRLFPSDLPSFSKSLFSPSLLALPYLALPPDTSPPPSPSHSVTTCPPPQETFFSSLRLSNFPVRNTYLLCFLKPHLSLQPLTHTPTRPASTSTFPDKIPLLQLSSAPLLALHLSQALLSSLQPKLKHPRAALASKSHST
ncbi:uncharacterized protein LY79DRAFT_75235 [Colletotrichum navitas]|uniref:Uncharacterized protein n=1 Tax=Colletotrichum navitas TaxID=681940 RepID=A0AAD8V8S2_9PEZI|nr:uncharacterized protein LY79DRAFT_75235 [Colletotrichum navitas]KAK1596016.1 hypothetical protein LY79DRAFT_75235 [Colletotrichum navitas]